MPGFLLEHSKIDVWIEGVGISLTWFGKVASSPTMDNFDVIQLRARQLWIDNVELFLIFLLTLHHKDWHSNCVQI
jgi:hypothetical protein